MSVILSERSSNRKRSKNASTSSQNEQEDLISNEPEDFISKEEREVIKVPNCSYSNEAKSMSKYFLCICSTSPKGFEPICEACAKVCHKKHAPTLEVPGANLCYCGLNNHIITPEMKQMFEQKKAGNKETYACFYSKFFNVIANKGFYKFDNKIYCSVCVQYCLKVRPIDEQPEFIDNDITNQYQCQCTKAHEINIIQLNADFVSKKNFFKHLREINYNLIIRIPKSKEIYIDTLLQEINNYLIKKDAEMNLAFFKDILVYKSLELFSMFSVYWENKFWFILPSVFKQYNMSDLFSIFSIGELINKLDKNSVINFTAAKFYFAELMFDYVIRTYTCTYVNLLNVKTILNMNLYQRLIYIHQLKAFHLYSKKPMENNYLDELVTNVVDLYDNILKINERFPSVFERIISYVFPTFNRILKYCIKYNIVTEETKKKYFYLVYETLQIHHEKKVGNLRDSCFYILKSVLYTLIYNNDLICYDYLQDKDTYEKKGFMFGVNEESLSLTKILLSIIEDYDRSSSPINAVTFDYYMRKIFELLLDKNDFYLNSIKNLDRWEIEYLTNCPIINITNCSPDDMKILEKEIAKTKNNIDIHYYDLISKFCEDMFKINRHYFEFDIEQNKYFDVVNSILTEFNREIENENFNMNEIKNSFCCFISPNPGYNEKLNRFKNAIFFSTFFQRMEEFCHICTASKRFTYAKEMNYDQELLKSNLQKLLQLLFILAIRDHKFLTLVMNIKPIIFATTFNDVYETLEEFLKRIIEMLYSPNIQYKTGSHVGSSNNQEIIKSNSSSGGSLNNEFISGSGENSSEDESVEEKFYLYDNYCFISDVIVELIKLNYDNYCILGDLMHMSRKLIRQINIKNSEYLNIIDAFIDCFVKMKNTPQKKQEIETYFDDITKEDIPEHKELDYFIYSYFDFMSELYAIDAYFFNCIKDAEFLPENKFEALFMALIKKSFYNIPIEVEYGICRYYLAIKNPLNFNFETINVQMKNLYMKGVKDNTNILHLSKKLAKDKNVIKSVELLDLVRRITDIFSLFDKNKLKSYYNVKDLRFMFKYFENLIVRPLFSAFNMYIIDIDKARGKDIYVFYRAVFYFLKICFDFYKCPKFETKSKVSDKIVYGFEEFIVKHELTNSVLEDIYNSAKTFSDNNIGYFEVERIFKLYIENIERIIKNISKNDPSSISNTSYVSENEIIKKLSKLNFFIAKKEKLKMIYEELKEKKYDNNLSLIQSYKNIREELEYDAAIPIINYLITKLFDPLTDNNKKVIEIADYENMLKDKTNLEKHYKFQNSYILIYLNCFFYNASEDFQNAFSSPDVKLPEEFYEFLIINIIFAINLHEIKKINDLDFLEECQPEPRGIGRTENLAFSTGRYAIKFIQNLCEGHNKEYQNKFFTMEFDHEEFLKDNINIYNDQGKLNAYRSYIRFTTKKIKIEEMKSKGKESLKKILSKKPEEIKEIVHSGTGGTGQAQGEKLSSKKVDEIVSPKNNQNNQRILSLKKTIDTVTTNNEAENIEEIEDEEKERILDAQQVSFFNLICNIMKMINNNLHSGNTFDCILFQNAIKFKNFENLSELYIRLSDLIVEMIQGTDIENFKKFYRSGLPKEFRYFTEDGIYQPSKEHKIYAFLELAYQIKNILIDKNFTFDPLSYNMKYYLFTIMNNILSQEGIDLSIVWAFSFIFPPDELLGVISIYLRGIYLSHYCRLNYNFDEFNKELNYLELNNIQWFELKQFFRENPHIYNDKYFQLAAQMYLFLTILAEKYNIKEAEKVKKYIEKETIDSKISDTKELNSPVNIEEDTIMTKITSIINVGSPTIKLKRVKPNDHNFSNDKIITAKFFSKIIKKCEFKIENEDELELKIIYFICDPYYYYISKSNKITFFKEVDRTSATKKLKSLIEYLDVFFSEIEFKKEINRKQKYKLFFLGIDYGKINIYNFAISSIINIILLLFLKDDENGNPTHNLDYLINSIVIFQILLNILYLYMFYISKYGFYVLLLKNKLGKNHNLTLKEKIDLYLLDSLIYNDETYLMILIIITSIAGLMTKYSAFLFVLQLLSIVKFIDTIKEILLAFKLKFNQIIGIIGFLIIFIYFFSNFEFFFLINEFNIEINGKKENFCQNLYECTINIFNHGVRSGGGIGDLLEAKNYTDEKALYFLRFVSDLLFYIIVVLLLLNMLNGVIVTTFSQIREESSKKEEDQKNRCFICNINRIEFQKNKIDFADHQKYEHNTNNYIKFFIFLWHINEKDMDADQSFINECIKEKDIKFFPVNCAKSIGEVEPDDDD